MKTAKRINGVRKPHTPHNDTFNLRREQAKSRRGERASGRDVIETSVGVRVEFSIGICGDVKHLKKFLGTIHTGVDPSSN